MIRITDGKMVWGQSAAGVLFVSKKTKRILLLLRSVYVLEPYTWGIISGKIDDGENPKEAATRESKEEIGYEAKNLIQVYVYEHGDFRFYNFICYVEDEFEPELNWENAKYKWYSIDELPDNLHYGVKDLFSKIKPNDIIKGNMSKIFIDKKGASVSDIKKFDKSVDELNKLDIDDTFFGTDFKEGGEIDIDIYKYADKIKEFVGSDLYRYYSKDEISFNKGGEMQSLNLAVVSGLSPANIIHAKDLGGIDRTKLKVISKGLEDKYFNKGDIILIKSNDEEITGVSIPLNKFLIALVPENTNQHIFNILSNNDIVALTYTNDENLKIKVQRMEYLYFNGGGKIPKKNKGGDCYMIAAKLLIENNYTKKISFIGTPYLVHGEVTGQGVIEGVKYGHAWVEDDVFVYDYSNGRELAIPKDLYYRIGQIVKKKGKYQKYTREQARKKMLSSGHYGCWDLDTKLENGGVLLTGGLSENMTEQDIANKYKISIDEFNEKLLEGMKVEKEHTNNPEAQKKIAKDHLFEDIDYYNKLKYIEELGDIVALPDCYVKLGRLQEVLAFQGYKIIKMDKSEYSDGGIVVGKSHSESDENGTGERFIVESTGQLVELEGGEIVINAESMNSDKKYDFEGKKMTAREVASELNHRYGGVKFNDGGKVSCGCGDKYYYGGELPSATLDSLSGGEGVINFKTSQSGNKYQFQNKKMTPREILSKINSEHGGKKF
jgi:8-oxo-dGTP pyrophosphatase MutT (NUDIX family)